MFLKYLFILFKKLKYSISEFAFALGVRTPFLYIFILRLKRIGSSSTHRIVSSKSDLTIDGFPRSGNSSFVRFFCQHNPLLSVANHVHNPAQLIYSSSLGKPTVLLIRQPKDACCSLLALTLEINQKVIDVYGPNSFLLNEVPSMKRVLTKYLQFYDALLSYKHKIVVLPFPCIIHKRQECIEFINHFFHVSYSFSNENIATVSNERIPYHSLPTETRNKLKKNLEYQYDLLDIELRERADLLYSTFSQLYFSS